VPSDVQQRLRETIETLEQIERPSASEGEREAAEWIAARFRGMGLEARIEPETAHGTYWVPLGAMTAAAGIAGQLSARGRVGRGIAAVVGALAAAGIVDDVSGGPHHFRRILKKRTTHNVVAEAGDPDAEHTVVLVAHHDAAHGGLVFSPQLVMWLADTFPRHFARVDTSPPVMQLVAAGPMLVSLGALTGSGLLRAAGNVISLGSAGAFADIATRHVVPGANDNLSAVATILEVGRMLAEEEVRGVRVILLSTGSEESFMEGMRGFARRHFGSLPRERTRVLCVESVGAPELVVIEGEGMIAMRDYPAEIRELLAECGERAGVPLRRGLRLGLATDGLIALKAGYPSAAISSVTPYKFTSNYHSHRDTSKRLDFDSVEGAVRVCREFVRASAPGPARGPARAS
jgi:hypothetical protein